jgi:LysR family hydrogen peroxide-inducible transcriptional activator
MELHQLRYFVAVADLGSFTRAAEKCLVAQPSLSQQVIKLEKELGRPLFERLGRTIRLTETGRSLYDHAVRILGAVEEARSRVTRDEDQMAGNVVVGAIPTIAPYLLPDLVAEFHRRYPLAHVIIEEDLTDRTVSGCARGDLDLGLLALPFDHPQLQSEPLFEEELLAALPATHPLARRRRLSICDLNGEAFILVSEMHCLGQQIIAFCDRQSCTPHVLCRSSQVLTVQELVSVGHGISLVPAMACRNDKNPARVYRKLNGAKPMRTIGLLWHRHRYQRPIVRRFLEMVRTRRGRHRTLSITPLRESAEVS